MERPERLLEWPFMWAWLRLATEGSAHAKHSKQGPDLQSMTISSAIGVSKLGKEGSNRIPGFTINSAAAAVPEIALVMLMSDRSKPAPAVAQLHFTREVKSGLLLKADQMISGAKLKNNKDNAAAEQSAKNQILSSDIGSSTNPIHGSHGSTHPRTMSPSTAK